MGKEVMTLAELNDGKFLSKECLVGEDGEYGELKLTILKAIKEEAYCQKEKKKVLKSTLVFDHGDKMMILNVTNKLKIVEAFGKKVSLWKGKSILVYVDESVKVGGKRVGGLRVRIPESKPKPEPKLARSLDERKEACKAALKTAGFELTEDDLESLSEIDNAKSLAEFFNSFKKEEA